MGATKWVLIGSLIILAIGIILIQYSVAIIDTDMTFYGMYAFIAGASGVGIITIRSVKKGLQRWWDRG